MQPPEPRPSAVIVLLDEEDRVYLVQRPTTASFFPGHHAFPGGGVDDQDGKQGTLDAYQACAVREVEEELAITVDPDALTTAGVTVTPPFSPIRFRTQFFTARCPSDQDPEPQQPELAGGDWFDPGEALEGWVAGDLRIPPPVIHVLEVLDEHGRAVLEAQGTEPRRFPITFARGLRIEPLESQPLPPHTHTNAFIAGEETLAVVDPGASGEALEPLFETLEMLAEQGAEVRYVLATHHHPDHAAGLERVAARTGAKIACSADTADRLGMDADVVLEDGDVLELGEHRIEVVATPGHAPGHLAFHVPRSRTMLVGDLVAGIGTVLIPPDEGDMAAYMESLERLAQLADEHGTRLLFPAHGPPSFHPVPKLTKTLEHRREREQRVLGALEDGARELAEIAQRAYEDKPEAPARLREMSTRAHLDKLVAEERAIHDGDGWRIGPR